MSKVDFSPPIKSLSNLFKYGAFYDDSSQFITLPYEVKEMSIQHTTYSNGISLASNHLVFSVSGTYNIQVSLQVTNAAVQDHDFFFWYAINNIDVPLSSSVATIPSLHGGSLGRLIVSMNIFLQLNAGDLVNLNWTSDNSNVRIDAVVPPIGIPISPSVIITATQVS